MRALSWTHAHVLMFVGHQETAPLPGQGEVWGCSERVWGDLWGLGAPCQVLPVTLSDMERPGGFLEEGE